MACRCSMNSGSGPSACIRRFVTSSRPRCQVVKMVKVMTPISSGNHAPWVSLVRLAAKNSRSMVMQRAAAREHERQRPSPLMAGVVEKQQGRDRDRAGHGGAVGVGQRGRGPEREHEGEDGHQQQPVDPRDVDLAHDLFRGVLDAQPRQVPEPPGLVRDRERAADDRLRGDDGRHGGQEHHREPGPYRGQQEERVADAGRVAQDQGALSQVIQDAGGEDDQKPGAPDRRAAEVSHVCVQRLGSGDGQDDGGQGEERGAEVTGKITDRIAG